MHPIHPRNFGNTIGKIRVRFTTVGGSVVDGFIVKQIGSHRFRVSNNVETRNCYLAQTTGKAATLGDESMTIEITDSQGTVLNVRKLTHCLAFTTQGANLSWKLDDDVITPGEGGIAKLTTPIV